MLNEKQTSNLESINGIFEMFRDYNNPHLMIKKIPTGFQSLDDALGGGLIAGVHTICAQPGSGKTTFALNIAVNAVRSGTPVIYLSYEMPLLDLATKMYSLVSSELSQTNGGFSFDDIRTEKKLTSAESRLYKKTCDYIESNFCDKIYFLDGKKYRYKTAQIVNEIEMFITSKQQKPLVVVDYIQMIAQDEESASLKENIENAMLALHNIAEEYQFPVVSISAIAKQGSDSLNMFSGAESARIAFGSVTHCGLTIKNKGDEVTYKTVELKLFKNRYGKSDIAINFCFDGAHSRFFEQKFVKKSKTKKDE